MRDVRSLLWAIKKVRRRIPLFLLLVVVEGVGAGLNVGFALGSRRVIDSAVAGGWELFGQACILQAAVILGILVCQFASRFLTGTLTIELDRDWKRLLLHQLLYGEYAQVSRYHSGELINRLNNDVRILDEGLISVLPGLVSMLVQITAALIALLAMEPLFAMGVVVLGLAAVVLTGLARKKLKSQHKRVSETDGKVLSYLQETMEKLMVVQALDVAGEAEKRADGLLLDRYTIQRKRRNTSVLANTCVSAMYRVTGFGALIWCAVGLLQGTVSFGTLTAVTQLVGQLQTPFVHLSGILPKYTAMTAAAERLMELEQVTPQEDAKLENPRQVYDRMTHLQARALTFAYDREPIIENACFDLPKGAFAAMTGPSGIGKSTLLKLLLGIYPPESGGLYLCGGEEAIPLNRQTRRLFAYVPQGNYLFSGTLRENLLLIRPEATAQELAQALHVSAMDAVIEQLPLGLETVLGENGQGLSEGQAQRLAIARALLSGAPILLLDEATSALDAETEAAVLRRIAALEDRTCIAVTHRPAAMELADWRLDVSEHTIRAIRTT